MASCGLGNRMATLGKRVEKRAKALLGGGSTSCEERETWSPPFEQCGRQSRSLRIAVGG